MATKTNKEKELEKQIEEMQKMMNAFIAGTNNIPKVNDVDRDVVFISLSNGTLNLSTEGYGQGVIYTFNYFGEEQVIPYADARLIIKNNKTFIENGLVYIADDDLIKSARLVTVYKKILDKDSISNLLTKDKKTFKSVFSSMTETQKQIISELVQTKLYKGEDIDMNIVKVIDEDLHISIEDLVKNAKDIQEIMLNNEE